LTGWAQTTASLWILYQNFRNIKAENDGDNQIDADGNGIADVQEISKKALFTRKFLVVLKASNPDDITGAVSGLWIVFLTVIAVLKAQFAQTLSLGSAIGDVLSDFAGKQIARVASTILPKEFVKYIPLIVRFLTRGVGTLLAWTLQRIVSAVYSSLRGAQLFVTGVLDYLSKRGHTLPFRYDRDVWGAQDNFIFSSVVSVLALLGCTWQLSRGMGLLSLPFPLNVLLFPFTLLESYIMYAVSQ